MEDGMLREVINDALARPPHERFPYLDREIRSLADEYHKLDEIVETLNYAKETWVEISDLHTFESEQENPDYTFLEAEKESGREFTRQLNEGLQKLVEAEEITPAAVADVFENVAAPAVIDNCRNREE